MRDVVITAVFVLSLIVLYRFRALILGALRRFDERNVERRAQEIRDRTDDLAHFRHTLGLAGEQVEDISEIAVPDQRTGEPVTRYMFEGEQFASRRDAARARDDSIREKARAFYTELPKALAARCKDKLGRE